MKRFFRSSLLGVAAMLACSMFLMAPMCQSPAPAPAPQQPPVAYQPPQAPAPEIELPAAVDDLANGQLTIKSLTITDNNGNARARIATGADGMASISLIDNNGKERAALYLDQSGNPVIYLADASGSAKTQYYLDPNGIPTLTYVDAAGVTQVVIPKDQTQPAAAPASRPTVIVTQPPSDTTTQPPDKRDTATVYVLQNFSNYHRIGCDRIKGKNRSGMSVTAARKAGYKPCPECKPMR